MKITFLLALVMLLGFSLAFRSRVQTKVRNYDDDYCETDWDDMDALWEDYDDEWDEVDYFAPEECEWWGDFFEVIDCEDYPTCVVTHGGDSCSCLDWW